MGKNLDRIKKIFKTILKIIAFIIGMALLYTVFGGNWSLVILALFVILIMYGVDKWSITTEKRLGRLESNPPHTGGISSIVEFSLELTKPLFETLQKKTGFSEDAIRKIAAEIPKFRFKIEDYAKDLMRVKIWYDYNGNRHYKEDDNPKLYSSLYLIWFVDIWDCLTEEQAKELRKKHDTFVGESLELSYSKGDFILYLKGGRFGEKEFYEDYAPLKKNILLCVDINNFKELEKYHLLYDETHRDATAPWYYSPKNEHRTYASSFIKEETDKGFYWWLNWYDFTGKILPKLKSDYKKDAGIKYTVEV